MKVGGGACFDEVAAGITDKGYHDLYDIVKMIPTKIEEAPVTTSAAQDAANRRHKASSDTNITDSGKDVNENLSFRFLLTVRVEEISDRVTAGYNGKPGRFPAQSARTPSPMGHKKRMHRTV